MLHDLTALEQGDAVRNGDVSPLELVELEPQLVKGRDTPVLASKILSKQGVRP